MSAANYISHHGVLYRLAADQTLPTLDAIQTPATPAPTTTPVPQATSSPEQEDLKTLELLVGNVNSRATAISTALTPLLEKVKSKSRSEADEILAAARGSLDSLVEDFKLLASKYAGVAKRSMGESKQETKDAL